MLPSTHSDSCHKFQSQFPIGETANARCDSRPQSWQAATHVLVCMPVCVCVCCSEALDHSSIYILLRLSYCLLEAVKLQFESVIRCASPPLDGMLLHTQAGLHVCSSCASYEHPGTLQMQRAAVSNMQSTQPKSLRRVLIPTSNTIHIPPTHHAVSEVTMRAPRVQGCSHFELARILPVGPPAAPRRPARPLFLCGTESPLGERREGAPRFPLYSLAVMHPPR